MSVFELFKANLDRQRIIGHGLMRDFCLMRDFFYAIDLLQNSQVDCIFDHYWFGLHELIQAAGRQAVYVTMLREPLERELSHLYFRRGIGGECENCASVEDWMTSPSRKRNRQSRFLCAYHDSPDAMRAFENLSEKYIAFGVAEYPHESIYMICKALGFKNIFVPWENVSKRSKERDERNEERRQIIRREDADDVELYARAKSLFLQRLASLNERDRIAIEELKSVPVKTNTFGVTYPTNHYPVGQTDHLEDQIVALGRQIHALGARLEAVIYHVTSASNDRLDGLASRLTVRPSKHWRPW
jgi:hypothetical protein